MNETSTEKAQVLIFDEKGKIKHSNNSLFDANTLVGKNIFDVFSVLKCIEPDVQNLKLNGNPLFLPHIAFAFEKYKSICDFIFMKINRLDEEEIVWIINDNSIHYQPVIINEAAKNNSHYHNSYSLNNKDYLDAFGA